jgi:Flp pilus assembly pilin Flp
MLHFITSAHAFLRDDRGQDLMEYGLLASLIAILVMVTVGDVGLQISTFWSDIVDQFAGLL